MLDGRCLRVHVQLGAFQGGLGQVGFLRLFILQVLFLFAALDLVQGRHGNEHMATLDDFTHLPEQEGEQQGTNVGAVYVGVRHDNDGVVTQFVRVEFFPADTATEGGNQRAHFGRRQHLVETGFLYVQDLTLQRQDGLGFPVTTLLGTATRRITLHYEQFRQGRIFFLAVGQLTGQARDVQGAFTASHVPRLAGGFPRPGRFNHLVDDQLGLVGLFLQVFGKALVQLLLNRGFHLGGNQFVLGLRRELRVWYLDADNRGESFTGVVAGGGNLGFLAQTFVINVVIQGTGQGSPEAGQVSTAIPLGDVIGETVEVFLEGVIPLHRHFY